MQESQWLNLAIQSAGAVAVCGMFLWYLKQREKNLREYDEEKEKRFFDQLDKQTAYLKGRDAQSKELADSGHAALREITKEIVLLKEAVKDNTHAQNQH